MSDNKSTIVTEDESVNSEREFKSLPHVFTTHKKSSFYKWKIEILIYEKHFHFLSYVVSGFGSKVGSPSMTVYDESTMCFLLFGLRNVKDFS